MNGPHFLLSLLFLLFSPSLALSPNDTNALTLFRLQTDTHANLLANWTGGDACSASWSGVKCSTTGRVESLFLPSLDLRGPIDSLSLLDQLRVLDLHSNRLNSTILPITNCTNLKLLYLSGNDFSGEIPQEISSLKRLLRLDLSTNNIHGEIPRDLLNLSRLLTLRLQNNEISGRIPDLSAALPNLKELNVSNNELYGRLPEGMLKKFGDRTFSGNEGLCGSGSLPPCSFTETPPVNGSSETVPSNPSSIPQTPLLGEDKNRTRKGLRPGAIVAIVVANCVVLLVVISFVVAYLCGRHGSSESKVGSEKRRSSYGSEKKVYANGGGDSDGTNATDRSKLVFYDKRKPFELEDLLRASAEMLGKGSLGTVYKAVLDDGCSVAVKRLKDANPCARKEFEQYMDVIGKIKHPNIVRLRAYYYAKEEKLLVYDHLPNGSLHSLLHENRGPGRIPLDWTTRISLVLGAARGLARIHEEYGGKIPHGNVKSSNVLLDKNGVALISDFGLSLLLNPAHAIARLGGYKAPEQSEIKRLSHKADVYSFGVLLLEVLTGRAPAQYPSPTRPRVDEEEQAIDLPKWVRSVVKEEWTAEVFDQELLRYKNIEEELVSMLHVGLACVAPLPEKRPTMPEVVKLIEDIRVEQSPLGEDYDESRNSLSPSLATTEDGLAGY
ncbi:leucine-rich repeat receptor-like protein kinase [Tripterygium wilfordii]|uniref:Leucine-rich repeat receptor-like protein kinase n=1 Tax=Tripterygium wilfordii TaxID=458696 RepID=A0A7J7DVY6_TRIWF|nr:leucine-rich repeat receptor-like protein kinase PXC1 [Tripterygium wilfordii]XP_038697273.1 leucine-rich repeat receptor-like protein kinase PXC1 [Tripterygium wilfordii]KAF5725265.1 leucine-rich repeat receptor-like protein kinase [Tripterygium wilfordii]KAF5750463.1 leucine-rich repeat receptor-like protein kinase [Tripterygium wilfordii]